MPSNTVLFENACNSVLSNSSSVTIKASFSDFVETIHDKVYEDYKAAEQFVGDRLLSAQHNRTPNFAELDAFFMSIAQSRKSRAGKVFEWILEELLNKRLGYPMDGQVNIDGAKPDFVLPSKDYFDNNPIDCMLLTAKRTLRERWRQVVTEANKTYSYFLATIDPKVTKTQLEQAAKHKIFLVTTKNKIHQSEHYAQAGNVLSFEDFIKNHLDPAMNRWPK